MTFNPNHKNKYDKPWGESGFYRSHILVSISINIKIFKMM